MRGRVYSRDRSPGEEIAGRDFRCMRRAEEITVRKVSGVLRSKSIVAARRAWRCRMVRAGRLVTGGVARSGSRPRVVGRGGELRGDVRTGGMDVFRGSEDHRMHGDDPEQERQQPEQPGRPGGAESAVIDHEYRV
ncbi:hypothetical protein IFM12275_58400 [Nocardia sputorum]|nr:hypothetical protein IFM12275_58400 [Nocardia sputorum]